MKKYIEKKVYELKDLVMDINDKDEIADATPYVGEYILKRMSFGAKRAAQARLVKIQTSMRENKIEMGDMIPDISAWQMDVLLYSINSCPKGSQPREGWGVKEKEIKAFIYSMPEVLGESLTELVMIMNDLTDEEQKN